MTFLPIIDRELRVRARARATFWLRFSAALVGLLVCLQQLIFSAPLTTPAALGRSVFQEVVGAAFLLCCSASLLAADAISSERREGTLGLLFLTLIRSHDVLLGKLVTVGVTSLCALIALLPALMLPMLAGGVGLAEAGRQAAALLTTLLLALSAGLFVSAAQKQRAEATRATVSLVAAVVILPYLSAWLAPAGMFHWLGWLSPLVLALAAGDASFLSAPSHFWLALGAVQALGWLLLFAAGRRLRRAVQEETGAAMVRPQKEIDEARRALGVGRWQPDKAETGPIQWVVYREQGVGAGLWVLAVLPLTCSRWMCLLLEPPSRKGGWGWWMLEWPLGFGGAMLGGAVVAFVASRFFASVRRSGELELLLTTPLGAATIVSEQWKALKRVFVVPVLLLQAAMLLPVLGGLAAMASGLPMYIVPSALVSFLNTFLGTAALCWLGLWFGLKARLQTGAIVWSVTLAQGVPWLLKAVLGNIPLLPELATLGFYLWLISTARGQLRVDLAGVEPMPFKFLSEFGFSSADLGVAAAGGGLRR